MISREMLLTLRNIKTQEENHGAALAPEIKVYADRTTLYKALDKLIELEAIESQEAPSTMKMEKTFTVTEFGKNLVRKAEKAEMID